LALLVGERSAAANVRRDQLKIMRLRCHANPKSGDRGARTNKPIAQLTNYALALTRLVPGLKLFDIKCARSKQKNVANFFSLSNLKIRFGIKMRRKSDIVRR